MSKPILEIIDVTVFRGQSNTRALDGFHLSVHAGECVAVCGHNGAGKSTLARLLTGLCKPASGDVYLEGHPLSSSSNGVRMVFQSPAAQLVGDTVYEELAVTLLQVNPTIRKCEIRALAKSLCQRVGLDVPLDTSLQKLSGGQLQRVCIAEALASGASVMVLDEAFASLDADTTGLLRREIRRIATEEHKAILMITHDMEDVLIADKVIVLEQGRLMAHMDTATFFYGRDGRSGLAAAHGFSLPYLVEVAQEVNRLQGTAMRPCSETALLEALQHGISA